MTVGIVEARRYFHALRKGNFHRLTPPVEVDNAVDLIKDAVANFGEDPTKDYGYVATGKSDVMLSRAEFEDHLAAVAKIAHIREAKTELRLLRAGKRASDVASSITRIEGHLEKAEADFSALGDPDIKSVKDIMAGSIGRGKIKGGRIMGAPGVEGRHK